MYWSKKMDFIMIKKFQIFHGNRKYIETGKICGYSHGKGGIPGTCIIKTGGQVVGHIEEN